MWIEAVTQAFKLFVLSVGFAIDEAKKHEQEEQDARTKRAIFETAVARALAEMRLRAGDEKRQTDAVDEEIDNR